MSDELEQYKTTADSVTRSLKRAIDEREALRASLPGLLTGYSEWLDGLGLVLSEADSGDTRSHEQLANEFLAARGIDA